MILVDILSIAEFILPPPDTLEHKTTSDKFLAEILQKLYGWADSPRADNKSHWGTPWSAGRQLDERCEWYRQRPETALGQWWVYEWRPPLSLATPPPVTNTHDQGVPRTQPTLPAPGCEFITSLFSSAEPNGGFNCSSRSLSSWVRRWGLRGEPARAWQKMEFTGEVLNLQHPRHVSFGGMKRHSLIGNRVIQGDPPVFWVWAEQRGQHHHLIFTGRDLSHGQDLVLGLWMADVQHGCRASPVLYQRAGSAISQLHWEVRSQLTLYILCGNLSQQQKSNKVEEQQSRNRLLTTQQIWMMLYYNTYFCLHCWFGLIFFFLHLFWKKKKKKRLSVKQW